MERGAAIKPALRAEARGQISLLLPEDAREVLPNFLSSHFSLNVRIIVSFWRKFGFWSGGRPFNFESNWNCGKMGGNFGVFPIFKTG